MLLLLVHVIRDISSYIEHLTRCRYHNNTTISGFVRLPVLHRAERPSEDALAGE